VAGKKNNDNEQRQKKNKPQRQMALMHCFRFISSFCIPQQLKPTTQLRLIQNWKDYQRAKN